MIQKSIQPAQKVKNVIITACVYIFAAICLYPFFLLVVTTFKEEKYIYDPLYIPNFMNFSNYVKVFTESKFLISLLNTIMITLSTLVLEILVAAMAGYIISRSKERVFKLAYMLIVCFLIIPAQTNMMVIYKLGSKLHLINTIPYLILIYVAGGAAFASLIYTAFTKSIPREIEESAKIDGCGLYSTFFRIILRLLTPATGAVIATTIFWWWNDLQGPLIYLNNGKNPTLMFEVFSFRQNIGASGFYSTQWGAVFTLCLLASLPMIILFLFAQKHLLKALVEGAVKG